jgi:hypothetical protein
MVEAIRARRTGVSLSAAARTAFGERASGGRARLGSVAWAILGATAACDGIFGIHGLSGDGLDASHAQGETEAGGARTAPDDAAAGPDADTDAAEGFGADGTGDVADDGGDTSPGDDMGMEGDAPVDRDDAADADSGEASSPTGPPLVWSTIPTPRGGSVRSIGSGWAVGSDPVGNGDFGIYRWVPSQNFAHGSWTEVPGGAQTISVDLNGTPWIVNQAGQVWKWTGSNWAPIGPSSFVFSAVASGSTDAETWAIQRSDQIVYHWTGAEWVRVSDYLGSPPKAITIAVFSGIDASCPTPQHSPVVLGTNPIPTIYFFSCVLNAFSSGDGAGWDISTDFVVDTSGNLEYRLGRTWNPLYVAAPWGTSTRIGAWVNGIFAIPPDGTSVLVIPPNR